ncbi:MAG: hypothetical protein LBM39_00135 [Candidatus Methanoplasma sp.]|jgi:hypothetical protein|nr:hypothetical protein [Candidatus Methanoplasma sp.]
MRTLKSEFDRSTGSKKKAAISAILNICVYVVLPLVVYFIIDSVSQNYDADDQFVTIFDILKGILILYLIFGIPLIILATFKAFYPKGSRSRLVLYIAMILYSILWLWIITSGGTVTATVEPFEFTADITWFIVILSLLGLLRCIIPYGEYRGEREKYLSEHPEEKDERPLVYTRH